MILVLRKGITEEEIEQLKKVLVSEGYLVREIRGVEETILGVVGTIHKDLRYFEMLPGVEKVVPISKPYKLVGRELHPEPSVIQSGECSRRRRSPGGHRRPMCSGRTRADPRNCQGGTPLWGRLVPGWRL